MDEVGSTARQGQERNEEKRNPSSRRGRRQRCPPQDGRADYSGRDPSDKRPISATRWAALGAASVGVDSALEGSRCESRSILIAGGCRAAFWPTSSRPRRGSIIERSAQPSCGSCPPL